MPRAKRLTEAERRAEAVWVQKRIIAAHGGFRIVDDGTIQTEAVLRGRSFDEDAIKDLLRDVGLHSVPANELAEWLRYVLAQYERARGHKDPASTHQGLTLKRYLATLRKFLKSPGRWTKTQDGGDTLSFNKAIPVGLVSNIISRTHRADGLRKAVRNETKREIRRVEKRINANKTGDKNFAKAEAARLIFAFAFSRGIQYASREDKRKLRGFVAGALDLLDLHYPSEDSPASRARFFDAAAQLAEDAGKKQRTFFDHPSGTRPPYIRRS